MYSVRSEVPVDELLGKLKKEEAIRANEVVELYVKVKSGIELMRSFGLRMEIAVIALEADLEVVKQDAQSRSLLDYCEAVYAAYSEPTSPEVDVAVAFVALSSEKGTDEWKAQGKVIKESLLAQDYVLDVNYSEQGKATGFFASFNTSKVPEGVMFSEFAKELEGVKKVHKVF